MVVVRGDKVEGGDPAGESRVPLQASRRWPVGGVPHYLGHLDFPPPFHGSGGARIKGESEPGRVSGTAPRLNVD